MSLRNANHVYCNGIAPLNNEQYPTWIRTIGHYHCPDEPKVLGCCAIVSIRPALSEKGNNYDLIIRESHGNCNKKKCACVSDVIRKHINKKNNEVTVFDSRKWIKGRVRLSIPVIQHLWFEGKCHFCGIPKSS
ncbi:hypothetical protein [Shimazuella alba]|uniref:Uncharacterized protein n=1 Tax=Shimazuella alba TaxID=2690964 RepID=A0A6I4VUZ7_9BACL|nr:hypothetical protein [Shimazuella alba]MXQ54348.1 hypothetical protein [Shimazuella alba]